MKGQRIKKRRLKDGDLFVIGEHELLYVRDQSTDAGENDISEIAEAE